MFRPLGGKQARRVSSLGAPSERYRPNFLVSLVCLNTILEGGIASVLGWLLFDGCKDGACPGAQPFGLLVAVGGAVLAALAAAILFRNMTRKHLPYLVAGNLLFGGFWVGLLLVDYATWYSVQHVSVWSSLHFFVADLFAPMFLALTCVWVIMSSNRAPKATVKR